MPDTPIEDSPALLPPGTYAIVEVMGHVRHVGRVLEVEQFGQKFCQVEPIMDLQLQEPVLVGGASIYQYRACTAEYAFEHAPQSYAFRRANDPVRSLPDYSEASDDDGSDLLNTDDEDEDWAP